MTSAAATALNNRLEAGADQRGSRDDHDGDEGRDQAVLDAVAPRSSRTRFMRFFMVRFPGWRKRGGETLRGRLYS